MLQNSASIICRPSGTFSNLARSALSMFWCYSLRTFADMFQVENGNIISTTPHWATRELNLFIRLLRNIHARNPPTIVDKVA